jgi:hypothetical protein
MARKQDRQPVVGRTAKKVQDSRRVRFGFGMAPARVARSADAATRDPGVIRFGFGMAPASLRK